ERPGVVAIDTNVLVRFLTADDPAQFKASVRLFTSARVFIPETVVQETEWVLRAAYDLSPGDVCTAFRKVLGLPNVLVADPRKLARVIDWHENGLDFSDALHLASSQGHESLRTFDKTFIKAARRLSDCHVGEP
ncbi:MAG: type II toxin-antitoxin system VapC family toxin, partial [Kiritimatiellia bacterium]